MADLVSDGKVRVSYVPTIANIAAPTTTELNAGTRLDTLITPDGLKTDASTGAVDTSALSSTFSTESAGRSKYDVSITCKRITPTDTAWNLLPKNTAGYLVVRRNVDAGTAWTVGDKVEVYPIITGQRQIQAPAENTVQRFTSPMFLTADANDSAVVA